LNQLAPAQEKVSGTFSAARVRGPTLVLEKVPDTFSAATPCALFDARRRLPWTPLAFGPQGRIQPAQM
jgi:hypothetical protein